MIGEGNIPSDVMIVGEYPGAEELRRGRPFVGRAGHELDRFLDGYTAPKREDVYLTNLKDEPPAKKGKYVVEAWESDRIIAEIDRARPSTVVTAGAHVTRWFLGDVTLEATHGIPHPSNDWPFTIFPTYNPAAILHSPNLQAQFAYDMRRLGLYLEGELPSHPVDTAATDYRELTLGDRIPYGIVGADTEGWAWKPWGLSVSDAEGRAFVVRTQDKDKLRQCADVWAYPTETTTTLVLHGSLHDLAVLRALGIDLDARGIRFHDTMIMAYLLGIEPQGLKPLLYRHLGMHQRDYMDVVAIPSAAIAEVWLDQLTLVLPEPVKKETLPAAKARKLIEAMLKKNKPDTLRARWANGRAREILVDEEAILIREPDPPEATLDDVELEDAVTYAGRDADGTARLFPILWKQIESFDLVGPYEVDIACVPMIDRMQTVGIDADVQYFHDLAAVLKVEEEIALEQLHTAAGWAVNPNSGPQVAKLLFDTLKLHADPRAAHLRLKKTKSQDRFSTNDKILDALKPLHPTVELVQECREIRKLKTTYAESIPFLVRSDGRLHPNYRITRADTGRLTAADPNVLAFPKHSARGKLIRAGFRAGPGLVLGEWDLNQIEMRVFAHDSADSLMIEQFNSGMDFHRGTAAKTRGIRPEDVTEHQRFTAKAENFGTLMGITEFGLADQLHKAGLLDVTIEDCAARLRSWMETYSGGADYIYRKHAEARRHGFVRDMWRRLRWLEGIHSTDPYIAAEAARQAQATPIQSGAQGIIKRGMVTLWPLLKDLRARGRKVECLLQIHDALVLEYDPAHEQEIDETVMFAMTQSVTLAVPVTAKAVKGVARLSDL